MRTLSLLLAIALVTFSGCTESPTGPNDAGPGQAGGNETATPTPGPAGDPVNTTDNSTNVPPAANLTADVLNGTAPLAVQFTIDGTDADGDKLTWVLRGNGSDVANGTAVPATFNHTISDPGNFTFTLVVSDGTATAQANVTIRVGAPGEAREPVVMSGSAIVPDPWAIALDGCLLDAGRRDAGGPDGITGTEHAIDPLWWGYSVSFDVDGVIAEFWGDGTLLGASATVPDEAVTVVVCINDPAAAPVDYVLTLAP